MLLSLLVFLPLCFFIVIALFPTQSAVAKTVTLSKLALIFAIIEFVVSLFVLLKFDIGTANMQMVVQKDWMPSLGVTYTLGIDGISLWLVLLTNLFMPLVVLSSWSNIKTHLKTFYASLFLLQTATLGSFLSLDLILFYVFFEMSLVPMSLIIGLWGGKNRIYASAKFFIFTMLGSVFMLGSIICLMILNQVASGSLSSNLFDLYNLDISFVHGRLFSTQSLLFFGFIIALAIKTPMFPLHTWLPDAHVQAPTAGSVFLAAVMLKLGTYGILRFVLPLFPEASEAFAPLMMVLALIGIIYGALVAMAQTDIKKLVAYSSVSHMGYVVLGLFSMNIQGVSGGLYQMLSHGVSTGALFFLVGMIYERTSTREVSAYGGLAKLLPLYTIAFVLITFSSIAVPLTNGFVGEFLILMGAFMSHKAFAFFAVSGVVLGAVYMLNLVKKVFYGPSTKFLEELNLSDLNLNEKLVIGPLILLVFWMGIFPGYFLSYSQPSLDYYVQNKNDYKLTYQIEKKDLPKAPKSTSLDLKALNLIKENQ